MASKSSIPNTISSYAPKSKERRGPSFSRPITEVNPYSKKGKKPINTTVGAFATRRRGRTPPAPGAVPIKVDVGAERWRPYPKVYKSEADKKNWKRRLASEVFYLNGGIPEIGISHKEPLYVVNINAKLNQVIVGSKEALLIKKIYLKDINLLSDLRNYKKHLYVKVRSTGKMIKANINIKKNEGDVMLIEGEAGVSPGQACVFYSKNKFGDKVLGGGWIASATNKFLSP